MSMPSFSAADARPRGTYAKYKRATAFFLRWLLRARDGDVSTRASSNGNAKQPLEVYERTVEAIAKDPTSLSPRLLRVYPLALDACASAITLRTRVAELFGASADGAHAHFLARLKKWFQLLQKAFLETYAERPQPREEDTFDREDIGEFANYYAVLAQPDDYFAGGDDEGVQLPTSEPFASTGPSLSTADRKNMQEDAFANDFHTELACLFMELEELSEGVYAAFYDVKREKKTLVAATVVAKIAITSAESVIASLQLRYPSVRDATDLARLIKDRMSPEQIDRLVTTVQTVWTPSEDSSEIRYQYVAGTILVDIVGIVRMLSWFATADSANLAAHLALGGGPYSEETTRHFVVPEWERMLPFFSHHLSFLLDCLAEMRQIKHDAENSSLT